MHYEGKLRLRSNDVSYCLREVVTKAGLTVCFFLQMLLSHFLLLWNFCNALTLKDEID